MPIEPHFEIMIFGWTKWDFLVAWQVVQVFSLLVRGIELTPYDNLVRARNTPRGMPKILPNFLWSQHHCCWLLTNGQKEVDYTTYPKRFTGPTLLRCQSHLGTNTRQHMKLFTAPKAGDSLRLVSPFDFLSFYYQRPLCGFR